MQDSVMHFSGLGKAHALSTLNQDLPEGGADRLGVEASVYYVYVIGRGWKEIKQQPTVGSTKGG